MGVSILESRDNQACLYCSTTMTAFGPVMGSLAEAEAFLQSLPCDARTLSDKDLESRYAAFVQTTVCECGEVRVTECTWCKNGLYPAAVNGTHTSDYDDQDTVECEILPAPANGERWVCYYCRRDA